MKYDVFPVRTPEEAEAAMDAAVKFFTATPTPPALPPDDYDTEEYVEDDGYDDDDIDQEEALYDEEDAILGDDDVPF
jgi:hypothetical protein